jgi:LmbE family N-acetylglucosaminyl deacetylase
MNSSFEMVRSFRCDQTVPQRRTKRLQFKRTLAASWLSWLPMLAYSICSFLPLMASAQAPARILQVDERYKVDILLVVAHPDDEGAATPYLARAIDEGKRVAVVYGTRGSSGANEAGAEQASALGEIREIEARRAAAVLGIDKVWFLGGKDTASQDVLQSLANWDHGMALENLVRIVRLTRPEVILTFLPGTFIGEDHGDHQASGVLATEAFDLAGDPTVFPEQVSAPLRRLEPYLENLRPWQTKKIYYFPDADKEDIFRDKGPKYSVTEISKSAKQPYWRVALESFRRHETQAKSFIDSLAKMDEAQIEKMVTSDSFWSTGISFVLGKSLVGGSVTGGVFEGITPGAIPFARPEPTPVPPQWDISVELAGPWNYYADFRRAHGLTHLPHPEPPEIAQQAGSTLVIPLWLRNQTIESREFTLSLKLPPGWTLQTDTLKLMVGAKQTGAVRMEVNLPPLSDPAPKNPEPQEVSVHAESNGKTIGDVKLRVELRKRALPE